MNRKVAFGWAATTIWILLWVWILATDWNTAKFMTFNEWGDFFSGSFAPLAFLWLVIGYFQQGEELSQNTKALEQQERSLQLQVDELKQSVEQQNISAIALTKQSEISSLMATLEGTNHIIDSVERQIERASSKNSADSSSKVKQLNINLASFEEKIEQLLDRIENLEGSGDGDE